MGKAFRVNFSDQDERRISKLQIREDNANVSCLVRIAIDRLFVAYPTIKSIDDKLRELADSAGVRLSVVAKEERERNQRLLEIGTKYNNYLEKMYPHLGYGSRAEMLRAVIAMFEAKDI